MTALKTLTLVLALLPLIGGCGTHRFSTTVEPRVAPIPGVEKLPLRAAILVTNDQRDQEQILSVTSGGNTYEWAVPLLAGFEDVLLLSFTPLFERLASVRAQPTPGAYQAVLVPRILDSQLELLQRSSSMARGGYRVSLTGSLRILGESGNEVVEIQARGQGDSREGSDGHAMVRSAVSLAVMNLIRRFGEQLLSSREVNQYLSRFPTAVAQADPTGGRPPAPAITISFSHPAEGARVTDEAIGLAGLISASRSVQRIELTVNGRPVPVSRDVRAQSAETQTHPFNASVPLLPGENVMVVTVVDATGRGAQAARTVFREVGQAAGAGAATAKLGAGERWAVVIGIDQYRDPSIAALRYATADAEAVFRFLTTRGGVKPANARLLLNQQATQRNIRQVLGDFLRQKALRDDEVIIYYAGHGTTEPDQSAEGGVAKYLVPWDADPQSLFSTAIPMEEIDRVFGRLAARKILMVQDTCFSGGAGGRTFLAKGLAMRSTTLTDRFLQDLSQKEGRMILTASDVNQVSQEDPALGHGIFTHYLLEALGGAADLDGDGAVTVREVHLYLQRKVHERSAGVQTPQLYNIGDMVLVRK